MESSTIAININQIINIFQDLVEHFPSSSSRGELDPRINSATESFLNHSTQQDLSTVRQNSHLRPHHPTRPVISSSEQSQDNHESRKIMASKTHRKPKRHLPVKLLDPSQDNSVVMIHGLLRLYA